MLFVDVLHFEDSSDICASGKAGVVISKMNCLLICLVPCVIRVATELNNIKPLPNLTIK